MKFIAFILLITIVISGTAQNSPKKNRKEQKEQKAYIDALVKKKVNELLRNKTFSFHPTYMFPRGRGSVALEYDYFFKVNKDIAKSYLPFWGTIYVVDYGHENSGYDFVEKFNNFKMIRVRKGYRVTFDVDHGSHSMNIVFHITYKGATSLTISSNKRQSMSYFGAIGEFTQNEVATF